MNHKRKCALILAILTLALKLGPSIFAAESAMKTFTYKPVPAPGTNLQADVFSPAGEGQKPVIVFIHGGALMMGDRKMSDRPGSLLAAMLKAGYVVVSIDYRLAPGVKLPEILDDLR